MVDANYQIIATILLDGLAPHLRNLIIFTLPLDISLKNWYKYETGQRLQYVKKGKEKVIFAVAIQANSECRVGKFS